MKKRVPTWILALQIQYLVAFGLWLIGTVFVFQLDYYALSKFANIVGMAQYPLWLIYFVVASQRLRWMDEARAERSAAVIFLLQRITGIIASVIAVYHVISAVYSVIYAVNNGYTLLDYWNNPNGDPTGIADSIVAAMPFVCTATFVVAEIVKFRLKRSAEQSIVERTQS